MSVEKAMPTVFITGANRGIGLEFARQYAAQGWQVIAACRTPLAPRDFASLGADVIEMRYDAMNDASVADVAKRLKGFPIDVAILCAEIGGRADLAPETVTAAEWEPVMITNSYAPLHLAARLEVNLRMGHKKVLVAISNPAASSQSDAPRRFAYRASKAALNQMWRNLSVDWKGWGCICLMLSQRQGDTNLTEAGVRRSLEGGVAGMRKMIDTATLEQSGEHWDSDGKIVAW